MTTEAKVLTGISIVTIAIVIGAALMLGGKSSPEKATPPVDQKTLIREDSHRKGPANAKVTIVEFGDFQCPACGAAHPVIAQLLEDYKGKVSFVFRNYPLVQPHKNAQAAAEAAEAAGAQGKFFEMYDALYSNQQDWSEKDAMKYFLTYAKELKLDVDKFKKEVEQKKYKNKIQQDMADGNAAGVESTPTFYINGVKQVGVLPYDEFKTKIEAALKAAK